MTLAAGTKLGPYEILYAIGAGGMGEVYQAHDTKLGRDVAIKVLPEAFAHDPQRMSRFQREAKLLASLNHPNIATIHGLEESNGTHYLVMELVPGETLRERVAREGALPVDEALAIARQIAEALEAAHEKSIIHRDLKPANVKVTPEGKVKVLDFGLAKAFAGEEAGSDPSNSPTLSQAATLPGVILGTPAYMSPEQAQGKQVDKRADIWAFGVVLYEMVTGRMPFRGQGVSETLAAVLKEEPLWDRVPAKVQGLVRGCLKKDPKQRLHDIADASLLLEETTQSPDRANPGLRHSRVLWVAALAVVAVVPVWIAWRATRPVDRPLMRFSADLGPEAVKGANITAAISPDGTRLAFVARGSAGKEQLATRLLDQAQAKVLSGTENAADPFFSPDGLWIGFFADGKMKKIPVHGGAVVTLCDAPGPGGASWGGDGSIIATLTLSNGSGLSRVAAAGGTPQAITKPREKGEVLHRWPQILPGGQDVLFTGNTVPAGYDDASIEVLSLRSGQWKVVQRGGYFGRYLPSGHLLYLHQGTLFAVGFNLDRLEIRGTPVPLLEDVAGNAAYGGGQYDVARNGTLVYLSGKPSNAGWSIAWMDGTGKTQPLVAALGLYFFPRFSPDGKRLALAVGSFGNGDIQVYDWQRDTMTRLTFTQGIRRPVWTPDGKHIAFSLQSPSTSSIRWIRADGAGEAQVLLEVKGPLGVSSFSPDGTRLALAEGGGDTGLDLWTLPLDVSDPEHPKPGKPELFLRTPFDEYDPVFSPDGRWIAYTSRESGPNEVYVRPFPGPGGKWQISTAGGAHAMWSHNGRELFYESADNHIMAATYTAKADSFAPDKPRSLSNTQIFEPVAFQSNLDLLPDGKRFAVIPRPEATSEQQGSVHVTVLLNFFDELRRKLAPGTK